MRRREFIGLLGGAALALNWSLVAQAQEAGKVKRIGFLRVGPPPPAWIEGLQQGLRELGCIDGENIAIEFGLASSVAQVPDVLAELINLKVDMIFASGTQCFSSSPVNWGRCSGPCWRTRWNTALKRKAVLPLGSSGSSSSGSKGKTSTSVANTVDGRAISAGPPRLGSIASRPAGLRSASGGQG
jgi:hypothetical protein